MERQDQQVDKELWNLDITIANFLCEKLKAYIEQTQAFPGDYTAESWKAKINGIVNKLSRYNERFDHPVDVEMEIIKSAQEAMHELADIFPSLWD